MTFSQIITQLSQAATAIDVTPEVGYDIATPLGQEYPKVYIEAGAANFSVQNGGRTYVIPVYCFDRHEGDDIANALEAAQLLFDRYLASIRRILDRAISLEDIISASALVYETESRASGWRVELTLRVPYAPNNCDQSTAPPYAY